MTTGVLGAAALLGRQWPLSSADARPADERQRGAVDFLRWVNRSATLLDLLREIHDSPSLCASAASRSYRHPLGFDKIVLLQDSEGLGQLRLHIWWPEDRRHLEHVHNHRFDLASSVLVGSLTQYTYRVDPSGGGVVVYRESSRNGETVYRFTTLGEVGLVDESASVLSAGVTYWLDSTSLHRIVVRSHALAMTLFLQGETTRDHSTIAVSRSLGPPVKTSRVHFSSKQLNQRLRRTLSTLAEPPGRP